METTTRLSNLRRDLINTHNISKDMQMEFIHLDNDIRILKAKLKNHGVIGDVNDQRQLLEKFIMFSDKKDFICNGDEYLIEQFIISNSR
jgi:hypothetical protein